MKRLLSFVFLFILPVYAADTFYEKSVGMLEDTFAKAPKSVKLIAATLNGKCKGKRGFFKNYAIFKGETGVGKSTLAYALAYKTNRDVLCHIATDFTNSDGRGAATSELNKFFTQALDLTEPTIVIIDEIDQLLKHYNSKHHDTDSSSKALWGYLDKLDGRKELFLVGTTNDITGFPPQMRSRLVGVTITITRWNNPLHTGQTIIKQLTCDGSILSSEARRYIEQHPEEHVHMKVRDIENFELMVRQIAWDTDHEDVAITQDHIIAAFKELKSIQDEYDQEEKKDEEYVQRERHHRESLMQQDQHHIETMQQQERHNANSLSMPDQSVCLPGSSYALGKVCWKDGDYHSTHTLQDGTKIPKIDTRLLKG